MGECKGHNDETGEVMNCNAVFAPLHCAASSNDVNKLIKYLKQGVDVNMVAYTVPPIYVACMKGHLNILKVLVKQNCDINATSLELKQTGLHIAASKNLEATVKYLLQNGALVNKQDAYGATPLFLAAQYGHVSTVCQLLNSGADINISDEKGLSPLGIATVTGGCKMAEFLINKKASLNQTDKNGNSALFHAVKSGQKEICKKLTKAGACVNLMNNAKEYPISIAAMYGNTFILDDLIRNGSDVNVVSGNGTPVFLAVQRQHLKVLQILIEAGADVTKVDSKHREPLLEALHQPEGNIDIVKELISSGSNIYSSCDCHTELLHSTLSKWNGLIIAAMVLSDCKIGTVPVDKLEELSTCCCCNLPSGTDNLDVLEIFNRLKNGNQPLSLKSECRNTIKAAVGPVLYKTKIRKLKQPKHLESYLLYDDVSAIL